MYLGSHELDNSVEYDKRSWNKMSYGCCDE